MKGVWRLWLSVPWGRKDRSHEEKRVGNGGGEWEGNKNMKEKEKEKKKKKVDLIGKNWIGTGTSGFQEKKFRMQNADFSFHFKMD